MKRYIRQSSETSQLNSIAVKTAFNNEWEPLDILDSSHIGYCTDNNTYFVINLEAASEFLNSPQGQSYLEKSIEDGWSNAVYHVIMKYDRDSYGSDGDVSWITYYNIESDLRRLEKFFRNNGWELPDYLIN